MGVERGRVEMSSSDARVASKNSLAQESMSTQRDFDWFPHSRMACKGVGVRGEERFSV
jgi:hypothetical protein